MQAKQKILITLAIGVILILVFYLATNIITKYTGFSVSEKAEEKDFEKCLKEQDIVLYINTENSAETLGKIKLVDYLEDIEIKNCFIDNQICLEKGVNSFPTWVINENKISKDISLDELSMLSGCKL